MTLSESERYEARSLAEKIATARKVTADIRKDVREASRACDKAFVAWEQAQRRLDRTKERFYSTYDRQRQAFVVLVEDGSGDDRALLDLGFTVLLDAFVELSKQTSDSLRAFQVARHDLEVHRSNGLKAHDAYAVLHNRGADHNRVQRRSLRELRAQYRELMS